jgi:hypothetical protein
MWENMDAWNLWQASITQWRVSGMGVVGLDYVALKIVADTMGIELIPILLRKIQVLERVELNGQSKRQDRRRNPRQDDKKDAPTG